MSSVPSAFLQAPQLYVPGKKPCHPVKLNKQHALSPSLFCGWFGESPSALRELVRGKKKDMVGDVVTSKVVQSPVGPGWQATSRVDFEGHFDISEYTSTHQSYTFSIYADWPNPDPNNASPTYFFDSTAGRLVFAEDQAGSNILAFYDTAWTATGVNIWVGRPALLTMVLDGPGNDLIVYIDGEQKYFGTTAYTPRNIGGTTILFNRFASNGNALNVSSTTIYYVMIHEGVRSPGQIRQHALHPFQMFEPVS